MPVKLHKAYDDHLTGVILKLSDPGTVGKNKESFKKKKKAIFLKNHISRYIFKWAT